METSFSTDDPPRVLALERSGRRAKASPTPIQLEVLRAVLSHGTAKAAATALYKTVDAVEWHLANLRRMAGVRHLHQLVARAAALGWLTPEDLAGPFQPRSRRERSR